MTNLKDEEEDERTKVGKGGLPGLVAQSATSASGRCALAAGVSASIRHERMRV